MRLTRLFRAIACLLIVCAPVAFAADWPRWSGPDRNMTASGDGVFDGPQFGLKEDWSKPLGSGYSGIVVAGDRLVTAFAADGADFVVALDTRSGEELWRFRIGEMYAGHEGSDDGPLATPLIHDGKVFALGPRGRLFALRLRDGQELWSQDLIDEVGARAPLYGFTTAPTLAGGVLVVQAGGNDGGGIAGFDPNNGKLRWSVGDDEVSYSSPTVLRIDGKEQLFAATGNRIVGLEPRTGKVLWSHDHTNGGERHFGNAQAVPVDDSSVQLMGRHQSALFRVEKTGAGYGAVEAWSTRGMYGSLVTPAPYEGHLYGYVNRRFVTCVNATTGQSVWKSREPGAGTLVLVDDKLVILTFGGELVVADATPEGYRERTRIKAFERGGYTWPTFAGGKIFLRTLTDIGSFEVGGEAMVAEVLGEPRETPVPELTGSLAEMVKRAEAAENPVAVVDEFMKGVERVPVLEGEDQVHFVFRGEVGDLRLFGNMQLYTEIPVHRIAGTDTYVRSLTLNPGALYEYVYTVFDETRLDPLNPRTTETEEGERSVLTTQGWKQPAHLEEPKGKRGRLETILWNSEIRGDEREVRLYLPAGHESGNQRFPLLIVSGGDEALDEGMWERSLDNLIGRSVQPLIVAFVPLTHFTELGTLAPDFAEALATELIPRIDAGYRTLPDPAQRGLYSTRWGGSQVLYIALARPELFGKVAAQSLESGARSESLMEYVKNECRADLRLYLEWSLSGHPSVLEFRDQLVPALEEGGCKAEVAEMPHGVGWSGWRQHTDHILEALYPLQ